MPVEQSWLDLRPGEWKGPKPCWASVTPADFVAPGPSWLGNGSGVSCTPRPGGGQCPFLGIASEQQALATPEIAVHSQALGSNRVKLVTCSLMVQPGVIPHWRPLMKAWPSSAGVAG